MALADTLKKVPVPVWLGLGGATLGLGYAFIRDKNKSDAEGTAQEFPAEDMGVYTDQYGLDPYAPSAVGPVYAAPVGDSGETVGAVGQTGLETLGELFGSAFGAFGDFATAVLVREPFDGIPQTPSPGTNPPVQEPPPQPAAPAPSPAPNRPSGYHPGGSVHNAGNTVRRNFSGASGWTEIATPDNRFSDFHVAYPNRVLQRWRGWGTGNHVPKAKRGDWDKIWEGRW